MPTKRNIVIGQRVSSEKVARAKELRAGMTIAENMLWQRLRRNQLAGLHFRRQQVIDGFIVDFYCHAAGLVVEVDGGVHEGQQQRDHDEARDRILAGRGLQVLRFTNAQVESDIENVLADIASAANQP